jgi:hypothetical protein
MNYATESSGAADALGGAVTLQPLIAEQVDRLLKQAGHHTSARKSTVDILCVKCSSLGELHQADDSASQSLGAYTRT